MPYLHLFPIDDEALRSDRPSHEVKWTVQTNAIVREGRLYPRPGFLQVSPDDSAFPSVERGIPVAIMQIKNPNETTSRQGFKLISETLRPTASSNIVAGWANDYQRVDEVVPDGSSQNTTTAGSQVQYTFPDFSSDFDVINCIVVRGRAQTTEEAQTARLTFLYRSSSTNYDMGSALVDIGTWKNDTTPEWQTFAIPVAINPKTEKQWVTADINSSALKLVMEFTSGQTQLSEILVPDADGAELDFVDETAGGTAGFADFDNRPVDFVPGSLTNLSNGASSSTKDAQQSWTYEANQSTFATINYVEFWNWYSKELSATPIIRLWFRPTAGDSSVEHTLGTTAHLVYKLGQEWGYDVTRVATNPQTSAAWTTTEIAAGEFGIQLQNTHKYILRGHQAIVNGSGSGAGLNVDTIAVDVVGADADEATDTGVVGISKLWSTTTAHLRMDNEVLSTSVDITNSVSVSSPGNQPLDWAVLYGQIYLVNGQDETRRYPTAANVWEKLTTNDAAGSGLITGKTVTAFADRILYGDVLDGSAYTPERVAYSKIFDGGTHNDDSAGDFDLLDTPGAVTKLSVLTEDICAAYKEEGVYALMRTGWDAAPIVRDVIDFQTGCLAPQTVKTVVTGDGSPVQLFLGFNPSAGYNVFSFNGTKVVPIGDPIRKFIRDDTNPQALINSFAEVDPDGGIYWLFMATGTNPFPKGGYYFNIIRNQWRKFSLPFNASCAGIWALAADTPAMGGSGTLMVGDTGGMIYKAAYDITHDSLNPTVNTTSLVFEKIGTGTVGRRRKFFTSTLETGDLLLTGKENPQLQSILNRVSFNYYDRGLTKVKLSHSSNGGVTFSTAQEYYIGTGNANGAYKYMSMDFDGPKTARRHRVKFEFTPDADNGSSEEVYDIGEIWLEWEPAGADP